MIFVASHFGEWLQGLSGAAGGVALVTLACPALGVGAQRIGAGAFALDQEPAILDPAVARRFLDALGRPVAGRYRLRAAAPPGGGAGLSTAGLLALARVVAGRETPAVHDLARACRIAEGASDPLMLARPDAVIWAPRAAQALGPAPPPPEAEIVGGFYGPPQRTDPCDAAFPQVDDLLDIWRRGVALPEAAALASVSSQRTTAMRGPADDPTPALARALGALGHARAHTGSARALIFAPGAAPQAAEAALRAAGFAGVLRFRTGGGA